MKQNQSITTIILALIAGLVGGIISCWFFVGAPVFATNSGDNPGFVTTERLQIVDENGAVRATIGIALDGAVRLSMLDENYVPRITMKAGKDAGSISLWDENGSLQVRLKTPASKLMFYDDNKIFWSAP
jgi:hypothetical protein